MGVAHLDYDLSEKQIFAPPSTAGSTDHPNTLRVSAATSKYVSIRRTIIHTKSTFDKGPGPYFNLTAFNDWTTGEGIFTARGGHDSFCRNAAERNIVIMC